MFMSGVVIDVTEVLIGLQGCLFILLLTFKSLIRSYINTSIHNRMAYQFVSKTKTQPT